MPDYSKAKIYKIVCDETNTTYYGSTVQPLTSRLSGHKLNKNICSTKIMINPKIFLVEHFSCGNKEELLKRERYYVENNKCINKTIPLRTKKEWYNDNKKKISEQTKQYRQDNKETIREQGKQKYECECGSITTNSNKCQHERTKKHIKFIETKKLIV